MTANLLQQFLVANARIVLDVQAAASQLDTEDNDEESSEDSNEPPSWGHSISRHNHTRKAAAVSANSASNSTASTGSTANDSGAKSELEALEEEERKLEQQYDVYKQE